MGSFSETLTDPYLSIVYRILFSFPVEKLFL